MQLKVDRIMHLYFSNALDSSILYKILCQTLLNTFNTSGFPVILIIAIKIFIHIYVIFKNYF